MSELEILEKITENFDKIDTHFDKIDARFDKMDNRFDKLEQNTDERFNKMDNRFDKMEQNTDGRFDKLESILEEQSIELYNIKKTLGNHSDQFVVLKSNIETIHSQAVRLSLNQAKLSEKIDKQINFDEKNTNENINSI